MNIVVYSIQWFHFSRFNSTINLYLQLNMKMVPFGEGLYLLVWAF
jgi:hypothetical protein